MKQMRAYPAFAFFVLVALGCGTADNPISEVKEFEISEGTGSESGHLELGQGISIGNPAPEFELPDGNGQLHVLSDHIENGTKVVLVFYRTGG
ncbi:hypothetical protein C6496_10715 [Candidatus Poribacteria bacterium]|nr:MAG: hypothetical protein C6496_10715 [Candidatus Poribacteria bacterium]